LDNIFIGFLIGSVFMCVLDALMSQSYKRILVMKSQDKTAECIKGKFYYIVPEEEMNKK
jgi:hypothetical protein